ncbi:MAG: glycosyltransferase family 4 protein [Candidatus Hydrothermae bacterium]|nr:glycosyltransferase family 4 protein [Candidatus Hydrothermae bacterium]
MKLLLLFTYGVSLETWVKKGLLDREKRLYEELLSSGHVEEVFWLTYGANDLDFGEELDRRIKVIPKPAIFKRKLFTFLYSLLMPILRARYFKEADVIKTNQMKSSWTGILASMLYGKPLYVRTGYTWSLITREIGGKSILEKFSPFFEWVAFKFSRKASVTSQADRVYVMKKYHISSDRLKWIPNYVDTELFLPLKRDEYQDRILFVGRLTGMKNLFSLFEAISGTPYSLDLFGTGELEDELRKFAIKIGAKVRFMGSVPNSELPGIINRYPLFVLPSLTEGMPKALLEAMACGVAVLGTNVPGIREVIRHGHNGWLVERDPQSIKKGIIHLMENPSLRARLGRSAREFIEENFSLKRVVSEEAELLREILGKKS